MSEERRRHIERVRDALKSEHRSQIPMSLKDRHAELSKALHYLKSVSPPADELPSTDGNDAGRRGTGLKKAYQTMLETERSFTDEENALLEC